MVNLNCGTNSFIRIVDAKHGITPTSVQPSYFCNNPSTDPNTHCFESYQESEMKLTLTCNLNSQCEVELPFLSFDDKCKGEGFTGDKYVLVKYECLPGMLIITFKTNVYYWSVNIFFNGEIKYITH